MMLANHHYYIPARVLTACCVVLLSACANTALNNQLATSREAVEQARTSGAPATDPADFNTASDKLTQANTVAKKCCGNDKAMRLAEQAQADADLAHAKTDSTHATTAAAELVKSNQALREAINGTSHNQ